MGGWQSIESAPALDPREPVHGWIEIGKPGTAHHRAFGYFRLDRKDRSASRFMSPDAALEGKTLKYFVHLGWVWRVPDPLPGCDGAPGK